MSTKNKHRKPRLNRVRVKAVPRPEPDWDRFAWALLQYTKALAQKVAEKP